MNKKFSTLTASLLLASAFTVNAAVEEGQFIRLINNGGEEKVLSIEEGVLKGLSPQAGITGANKAAVKESFGSLYSQWWKVAKISKTSTGQKTYQFVNKKTGEFLAIKLVSDNKTEDASGVRTSAAKLNQVGNRDWAFDGSNHLYAYNSSTDSTYAIKLDGANIKLLSKKGSEIPDGATEFPINEDNVTLSNLNADVFNALMELTGNDGKLHFNGKDVSSEETNVLKDTKWTAYDASGNKVYLTNGATKSGYTNTLEDNGKTGKDFAYIKINKKKYLQVDTLSYDDAGKYLALAVDTIPYDKYVQGEGYRAGDYGDSNGARNTVSTRNNATAQWAFTYSVANDSISLIANAIPVKSGAGFSTSYDLSENANLATYTGAAMNQAKYDKEAIDEAIANLKAEFETWKTTKIQSTTVASGSKFSEAEGAAALIAAVAGYGTEFATFANVYGDVQVDQQYTEAVDATLSGAPTAEQTTAAANSTNLDSRAKIEAFDALKNAYEAWVATKNTLAAGSTFASTDAYTTAKNAYDAASITTDAALTAYTSALAAVAIDEAFQDIIAATTDFEQENATTAENAMLATNVYNYKTMLDALLEAYDEWKAANPVADQTFADASADEAAYTAFAAVATEDAISQTLYDALGASKYTATQTPVEGKLFFTGSNVVGKTDVTAPVVLRKLSSATVLTVNADGQDGYIKPLIQPYATTGGDAKIATTNYHFIQVKNVAKDYNLRAATLENKYWAIDWVYGGTTTVSEVSEANPYTQWAFVEGSAGSYSIVNRATADVYYTGPLFKVADAENTYTNGTDTLKVAAVEIPETAVITEGTKKYDTSAAFYAGKDESLINRLFAISPVSPFMSQLSAQFNKDSVMILGDAEDAPVWRLKEVEKDAEEGYVIPGTAPLLYTTYNIYTMDIDKNVYYVVNDGENGYVLTKSTSEAGSDPSEFVFLAQAKDQYLIVDDSNQKMTINPTPAKPILEASILDSERNDLFTFTQVNQNLYRTLTAEDGVLGNAKIYMENEPNRYLYENTANIVANNGTGYNFLGIYNTAELTKNAALYVDTAYVNRENNLMPQYMFALGLEKVAATDGHACTEAGPHFDKDGNKTDAEHCVHATAGTDGYRTGRYLVALSDSVPTTTKFHPTLYDGATRLAFVPATRIADQDSIIINNSKWTGNSKQIVAGDAKTYASKDTLAIADQALNPATFALLIKDQATKSFYLENAKGYVRILNGVPVLTNDIEDAAVFNIEATTEEATANEAIEAAGVQVIGGQGAVTVQGAAGKVITVANILGQTIANQVAASDNVTIAVPAGIVVVAVEGEATKVVVK